MADEREMRSHKCTFCVCQPPHEADAHALDDASKKRRRTGMRDLDWLYLMLITQRKEEHR